ncbi:NAD(P)/FAD-dependent oxidoreductase [Flavobacteriaceae bacterium F89]|uniref:NAD(P)/FAD-dependent oxidoreductase n=1 Tax=Cerina litoralis TaxID=2874477 RepID=A0AAE3EUS8_9FLAO|nr:NAD(P)/FAD-dependent oxidoreductase [Cerina litoralis]MCG2460654.1 NAD(P)/FAD-dependent oxidoreductase [Cerina litoralis]
MYDVLIIGGGAAGFYAAIHIAEADSNLRIAILERGKEVLTKVKVSGGGRCNVTHAEFDPNELVKNYPRGQKELLGPFHSYCSGDTVAFFEERGIPLKMEPDGRMFPQSNTSQTIIDCFVKEAERLGVQVLKNSSVTDIRPVGAEPGPSEGGWSVQSIRNTYRTKKLLIATGSNPKIWKLLENLGHTVIGPVPSLFTFNIQDDRIAKIPGVSADARVMVVSKKPTSGSRLQSLKCSPNPVLLESEGPLLITHWGMSGPAILKLSAWGAKLLHGMRYKFTIRVNWLPDYHSDGVLQLLLKVKEVESKKTILRTHAVELPKRLWINLAKASGIAEDLKWADVSKSQLQDLACQLTQCEFSVDGKSTFKEEFVTAGGVDLREINFKTYESKILPNLYFAGEVMDVDAITGGFNFQNAWTGAYIAAKGIVGG